MVLLYSDLAYIVHVYVHIRIKLGITRAEGSRSRFGEDKGGSSSTEGTVGLSS